jgi:hypothetical protein
MTADEGTQARLATWRVRARADLRRPGTWLLFVGLYAGTFLLVATTMYLLNLVVPLLPWIDKPYVSPDPPPLITAFYCANLGLVALVIGGLALYILGPGRWSPFLARKRNGEEKQTAALTPRESWLLLGSSIITGIVAGFSAYFFRHTVEMRWVFPILTFLGPGTWFYALCGFGPRGPERRALFRDGSWFWFNVLAILIGGIIFMILWFAGDPVHLAREVARQHTYG